MTKHGDRKIVILDGYCENPGDLSWDGFKELGDVTLYDRSEDDCVIERIADAQVIIVNKTRITKEVMDACPNINYIGVLATGYDVVDVEEAKKHGIALTNVPGYGTDTVSQYAIAMLLEVCNRIGHHHEQVKKLRWSENADWCFWDYPLIELAGKTIGIIGYGRIGQATGRIAQALGMNIVYYDTYVEEGSVTKATSLSLNELLKVSDVVALHCPLTKENEKLINKDTLALMKKNAILINNARGKLIDEADLAKALREHQIFAAALDVTYDEPIANENPLLNCENCFITPHISWATKEARERIMNTAVENLDEFDRKGMKNRIV